MVRQDIIDFEGRQLCKTYSDAGLFVHKVGTDEIYEEAVDVYPCPYAYEEIETNGTDEPDIEDSEALRIITGVNK